MEPFTRLTSAAASLPQADIDTDIIFPARFLLITERAALGAYAFYDWRFTREGVERSDFVFNQPAFRSAKILLAGANFGCGSSREHAPWALHELGLRCLVAPSFGDIFYANCLRNGMLPIVAGEPDLAWLRAAAKDGADITVDLLTQRISTPDGAARPFEIEPARREALLKGWDEIAVILQQDMSDIVAFEAAQRSRRPWLYTE